MSILSGEEQFFKKIEKYKQQEKDAPTLKRAKKPRRKLKNVQQKSYDAQRQGIDTTRVPQRPGTQGHHLTSLHNASPFFEGLDVAEKAIMGQKFAQYGLVPGDLSMNRLDMFARLHQGGIHTVEGKNILNLAGKQYFKPDASFQAKLGAVEQFAADQKLLANIAKRMQYTAEFTTSGLTERVEATATPKKSAEYQAKDLQRREQMWRDFAEYGPEQHSVATALGPQMQSDNLAREKALQPYWNSDGSFDIERLKADTASGKFVLPKAGPASPFKIKNGSVVTDKPDPILKTPKQQTAPITTQPVTQQVQKTSKTKLKPTNVKGSMRLTYGGGIEDIPEIQDKFDLDPGFGTPLGGGRTVEMGDFSLGTI